MRQAVQRGLCAILAIGFLWQESLLGALDESLFLDTPVRVNGVPKGSVRIALPESGEEVLLHVSDLTTLVDRFVSDEGQHKCREMWLSHEVISSPFQGEEGFFARFCEEEQVVEVGIPISWIRLETISLTKSGREEPEDVVLPALWSGQANFYFEKTFNYLTDSCWNHTYQPGAVICEYCFNHVNWTLEGRIDFGSEYYKQGIWREALLTEDLPDRQLRKMYGNVSPNLIGAQKGVDLLGMGISKDPALFSSLSDAASGGMQFFLEEPARVDLFLNGHLYTSLRLAPGPHVLTDLPPIFGENQISLSIHRENQPPLIKEYRYAYFPAPIPKDLLAYSWSVGFPQSWKTQSYLWDVPLFTCSGIYGIDSFVSKGAFFQVSSKNLQFGSEMIWFFSPVRARAGWGYFWTFPSQQNLQFYGNIDNGLSKDAVWKWNANLQYLGQPQAYSFERCHMNRKKRGWNHFPMASASLNGSWKMSSYLCSLGGNGYVDQKWRPSYGYSGAISTNYSSGLSASLSGYWRVSSGESPERGIIVSITGKIPDTSYVNYFTYFSDRQSFYNQLSSSRIVKETTRINHSVGIEVSEDQKNANAQFFFNNPFLQASAMSGISSTRLPEHRHHHLYNGFTNLGLGTCLLFADGELGISQPNYDSFILVQPNREISPYGIRVNDHQACSWKSLPAVLDNVSSYDTIGLRVSSPDLALGYQLGRERFWCKTGHRTGTLIRVGEGKKYVVEGRLQDAEGKSIPCVFGWMTLVGDSAEPIEFFTNRAGEFQVELESGRYAVTLARREVQPICIEIGPQEEGFVDVGCVVVEERKECIVK